MAHQIILCNGKLLSAEASKEYPNKTDFSSSAVYELAHCLDVLAPSEG